MKLMNQIGKLNLALMIGVLSISLVGCGKKDDDKDSSKKDLGKLLVGKWAIDVDGTVEKEKQFMTEEELAQIEQFKQGMSFLKMTMQFDADGSASMTMGGMEPDKGRYEVTDKGDHLVVKILDSKKAPPSDAKVTFENDDKMVLEYTEDSKAERKNYMVFTRVKE